MGLNTTIRAPRREGPWLMLLKDLGLAGGFLVANGAGRLSVDAHLSDRANPHMFDRANPHTGEAFLSAIQRAERAAK